MIKPALVLIMLCSVLLSGCTRDEVDTREVPPIALFAAQTPDFVGQDSREDCANNNPEKNAYFGALHIHSSRSFDAWVFGNNNDPYQAYAFAKGEEILAGSADNALSLQLQEALDFAAVTDHSENYAQNGICSNTASPQYDHEVCQVIRGEKWWAKVLPESLSRLARVFSGGGRGPLAVDNTAICGDDPTCTIAGQRLWLENQHAAEQAYDRSSKCEFTSFPAYEYSLTPKSSGNNMHRNVFFRSGTVLNYALSADYADNPLQLWQVLDDVCNQADNDCKALVIPHNSNLSAGAMFSMDYGKAESKDEQAAIAALRARTEPLAEIYQVKGDSECRNGLSSVLGRPDEACNFEKIHSPRKPVADCGDEVGDKGMAMTGCVSRRSFVRYALADGLAEKKRLGVNPLKLGIVAASDTHESNGGDVDEKDRRSALVLSNSAEKRLAPELVLPGGVASVRQSRFSAGGLAGVFAPHNSRDALFDAMQAKETFGTSGPRIVPRFFAGKSMPASLCDDAQLLKKAYAAGVPMGGDLQLEKGDKPQFLVSAIDDPSMGAELQRLQIIKVWPDDKGQIQQRVFDVAGSADNGASVDLATCEPQGVGAKSMCAVWQDEQYSTEAVYYARVLENPSCRWSTYECNAFSAGDRPETCDDPDYPKTIQERAWTSPIWVSGG